MGRSRQPTDDDLPKDAAGDRGDEPGGDDEAMEVPVGDGQTVSVDPDTGEVLDDLPRPRPPDPKGRRPRKDLALARRLAVERAKRKAGDDESDDESPKPGEQPGIDAPLMPPPGAPLFWLCECGRRFREWGRERPGDDSGWRAAQAHVQLHKKNGEPERLAGLYAEVEGELQLAFTGWRPQAVAAGILPYGDTQAARLHAQVSGDGEGGPRLPTAYSGIVYLRNIPIRPELLIIFQNYRKVFPDQYPDDQPHTIGQWILDVAIEFTRLFPDVFAIGKMIQEYMAERGVPASPSAPAALPNRSALAPGGSAASRLASLNRASPLHAHMVPPHVQVPKEIADLVQAVERLNRNLEPLAAALGAGE